MRKMTAENIAFLAFYDWHRDDPEYQRELEKRMKESEVFRRTAEEIIEIANDPDIGPAVASTDAERAEATFQLGEEHERAWTRLGRGRTAGMYFAVHEMRLTFEAAAAGLRLDPRQAHQELVRDTFAIATRVSDGMIVMPHDVDGSASAARALRAEPNDWDDGVLKFLLRRGKDRRPEYPGPKVTLLASQRMDVAVLVDYVLGRLTRRAEEEMWRRVRSDVDFRLRAHFVFAAWSVPPRSDEVIDEAERRWRAGGRSS